MGRTVGSFLLLLSTMLFSGLVLLVHLDHPRWQGTQHAAEVSVSGNNESNDLSDTAKFPFTILDTIQVCTQYDSILFPILMYI